MPEITSPPDSEDTDLDWVSGDGSILDRVGSMFVERQRSDRAADYCYYRHLASLVYLYAGTYKVWGKTGQNWPSRQISTFHYGCLAKRRIYDILTAT